jgi:hypothetical protein
MTKKNSKLKKIKTYNISNLQNMNVLFQKGIKTQKTQEHEL